MGSALFNVLFKIIGTIVGIFTAPINLLLINLFPDFTNLISNFNSSVSRIVGGGLAFFSSLLPPITKATILIYLGVVISYYTIAINIHLILKVVKIIKNIKIW